MRHGDTLQSKDEHGIVNLSVRACLIDTSIRTKCTMEVLSGEESHTRSGGTRHLIKKKAFRNTCIIRRTQAEREALRGAARRAPSPARGCDSEVRLWRRLRRGTGAVTPRMGAVWRAPLLQQQTVQCSRREKEEKKLAASGACMLAAARSAAHRPTPYQPSTRPTTREAAAGAQS